MSKIGHASKDERGKYTGGKAGDQTKAEVATRSWYSRPWTYVLRANEQSVREKIAYAMERACANDKIGYDQWERNTLLANVRNKGYDPGKADKNVECDCSSLVSVCCMYAGIPESVLYKSGNCSTTSNLRTRLVGTGKFVAIKEKAYLNSPDYLLRGDILLYEGHHVAVNLENGKALNTTSTYYPKYNGTSKAIDTVFANIGADKDYNVKVTGYKKRLPIAIANNISNYSGSATQNLQMIDLAKIGKLKRV